MITKIYSIFLATVTCIFCTILTGYTQNKGGFKKFRVDTGLPFKMEKAKTNSMFKYPLFNDGYWGLFIDDEDTRKYFKDMKPLKMLDTLQRLSDVPCDCMMRHDTIFIQGGIAYGGGLGFNVIILKNKFEGEIWIAGVGYRTDPSKPFKDEISLKSVYQTMKIQSTDSLKFGSKLIGEITMESEEYFKKNVSTPAKVYLKLLFGCKLDDFIAF